MYMLNVLDEIAEGMMLKRVSDVEGADVVALLRLHLNNQMSFAVSHFSLAFGFGTAPVKMPHFVMTAPQRCSNYKTKEGKLQSAAVVLMLAPAGYDVSFRHRRYSGAKIALGLETNPGCVFFLISFC